MKVCVFNRRARARSERRALARALQSVWNQTDGLSVKLSKAADLEWLAGFLDGLSEVLETLAKGQKLPVQTWRSSAIANVVCGCAPLPISKEASVQHLKHPNYFKGGICALQVVCDVAASLHINPDSYVQG